MLKSLYSHELFVVCRHRPVSPSGIWYHHLWTVLLATGLVIETLFWHIYSHIPLVYAHEILLPLLPLWLIIEPSYLTQMCVCTRSEHTEVTRSLT